MSTTITHIFDDLQITYARAGEHHHVRDGWIGVDCPWCPPPRGDKGRYRLGVEIASGRSNCWVCGSHSLASVLVETAKIGYRQASDLLIGVKLRRMLNTKDKPAGSLSVPKGVGPMLPAHRNYLASRGFKPDQIEKLWGVQGIGLSRDLQWRLFIPIALHGEMVSWTTRSIGERSRYVNAQPSQERLHLKDSLYGVDLVRSTLIVVEGPTDTWAVGPGAAATYGLKWTTNQIAMMTRFPKRIVCFDNEPGAQKRARVLCGELSLFPGRTINIQLDAKDPGSASRDEIKKLRKAVMND